MVAKPASDKQIAYLASLSKSREHAGWEMPASLTSQQASDAIEYLLGCPVIPRDFSRASAGQPVPGVYRKDGRIYVIKPNRAKTAVYAKELVESAPRETEAGTEIPFEMVYTPGMARVLTEAERMPLADAADILTRYSACIVCGRTLKAAESVRQAIGPVCVKMFA